MSSSEQPGQLLFAGFDGTTVPPDLARLVSGGRLGGVIFFAPNVESPQQLRALADELHALAPDDAPLTLAIDQEGGRVQRCRAPWTEWPPMRRLGSRSLEDTRELARALARELADLRIDLDFAPCVDVDTCPDNPVIGDRSFSDDADTVAEHGAAFIEAMQAEGVAACAKHFPGHGDTVTDSHLTLPRLEHDLERLRAVELPPFRAAAEAGVASVMTAHVLFPQLDPERPATLAPQVLALLREEIGYDGLVFSDDLEMAAVAERYRPEEIVAGALSAGVDSLLVRGDPAIVRATLGALEATPTSRLERPLARMRAFKRLYSGGLRATGSAAPYAPHRELAARLAGETTRSSR